LDLGFVSDFDIRISNFGKYLGSNGTRSLGAKVEGMETMTHKKIRCSKCGNEIEVYQNPIPTVDIIIEIEPKGIVLIKRKNPPYGWAIPGGFVDYGETLERAAMREAKKKPI